MIGSIFWLKLDEAVDGHLSDLRLVREALLQGLSVPICRVRGAHSLEECSHRHSTLSALERCITRRDDCLLDDADEPLLLHRPLVLADGLLDEAHGCEA